jgi:adenylosuccinate lyase
MRHGVGRETAHEVIKEHAVSVALAMRENGTERNDLLERLASDPRLGLGHDEVKALVSEPLTFTGAAVSQVARVAARVDEVVTRYPEDAGYTPSAIL